MPERDADINILVTHGLVPNLEARQHEMGEANLHAGMLEGAFDYIALGHYHEFHKHKENSYYSGATERFSFGEVASEPGFAIVEFDGGEVSVEQVKIETRPMIDLPKISAREMDAARLTDEVRKRTEDADLDGAIVRLRAYDVRRGVASGVDRDLLRDLQRRCLNFSLEIHAEESPETQNGGQATATVETSADGFGAVRSHVEIAVRDGVNRYPLDALQGVSREIRVRFDLVRGNRADQTPVVDGFRITGEPAKETPGK